MRPSIRPGSPRFWTWPWNGLGNTSSRFGLRAMPRWREEPWPKGRSISRRSPGRRTSRGSCWGWPPIRALRSCAVPSPKFPQWQEPSDIPLDEMSSPPSTPTNKKRAKEKTQYAKLSVELWDNPVFCELDAEAKYLYVALHFGRSSNMSGLFPVTRRMLKDFGLSRE